jgi:hypothetical protein
MRKAKALSTKKAKYKIKTAPPPSWALAIADAEAEIADLKRSIELFKHNEKIGLPFPQATHN